MRPVKLDITMDALDADGICAAQTNAAAGDLIINGDLDGDTAIAQFGTAQAIRITCAGADAARTFTITGEDGNGNSLEVDVAGADIGTSDTTALFLKVWKVTVDAVCAGAIVVGTAEDDDSVSTTHTPAGAVSLPINGVAQSTVVLDVPRHISFYGAGVNTGITFAVVGIDRYGDAITETVTGPGAGLTVKSDSNFKTVLTIRSSGAVTGNITVGSADELESKLQLVNSYATNISYQVVRDATADFTHRIEFSQDDFLSGDVTEYTAKWQEDNGDSTDDESGVFGAPITAVRLVLTNYLAGSAALTLLTPNY